MEHGDSASAQRRIWARTGRLGREIIAVVVVLARIEVLLTRHSQLKLLATKRSHLRAPRSRTLSSAVWMLSLKYANLSLDGSIMLAVALEASQLASKRLGASPPVASSRALYASCQLLSKRGEPSNVTLLSTNSWVDFFTESVGNLVQNTVNTNEVEAVCIFS